MTRRQIIASLNEIANELDNNGLYTEANSITNVMKKIAIDKNRNIERKFFEGYKALNNIIRTQGVGVHSILRKLGINSSNPSVEDLMVLFNELDKLEIDPYATWKLDGIKMNYDGVKKTLINFARQLSEGPKVVPKLRNKNLINKYKEPMPFTEQEDIE